MDNPIHPCGEGGSGGTALEVPTRMASFLEKFSGLDNGATMRRISRVKRAVLGGLTRWKRLKFMTLTFDPEFGFPFRKSFTNFVKEIRKMHPDFQYMGIHVTDEANEHIHLICNTPFIAKGYLSSLWQYCSQSTIVDIRSIYNAKGAKHYLSNYLKTQGRLITSRHWLVQTWQKHWNKYAQIKKELQKPLRSPPPLCLFAYYRFWWATRGDLYFRYFLTTIRNGFYLLRSDDYWGSLYDNERGRMASNGRKSKPCAC